MATYNSVEYQTVVNKRTTGAHAPLTTEQASGKLRYVHATHTIGTDPLTGAAYVINLADRYNLFELPNCRITMMRCGWGGGALGDATSNLSVQHLAYTSVASNGDDSTVGASTFFTQLDAAATITVPFEYHGQQTAPGYDIIRPKEPVVIEAFCDTAVFTAAGALSFWVDCWYVVE